LICRDCGAIEQLDHALLEELIGAVQKQHRFNIDVDHIALFGLCRKCRNNERNQRALKLKSRRLIMLYSPQYMHIPDGYLSPLTCLIMLLLVLPFWYHGVQKMRQTLMRAVCRSSPC